MKRKCGGCGGEIPPTRSAKARYCNTRCRNKALWKRNPVSRPRPSLPPPGPRTCPGCSADIPTSKNRRAVFCSRPCKDRHNALRRARADPEKSRAKSRAYNAKNAERLAREAKVRRHLITYGHTLFVDDPMANPYDRFRRARAEGYRSGLEVRIANQLKAAGVPFEYEPFRIPFQQPSKPRSYTPDVVLPNGIVVESKGRFVTQDRQKHKLIKEQYPDLELRFVFSNASNRISKQSRTTYSMWATTSGFVHAEKDIPPEWFAEAPHTKSLAIIERLRKETSK